MTAALTSTLERMAREHPDAVAMRCPGPRGDYAIALTYGELDARSRAIASGLARRGIVA